MSNLVKIAEVDDLSAAPARLCIVHDRSIALFRSGDQYYAVANACPHRGGSLANGTLDGQVVTCPLHGWRFDVTTGGCVSRAGMRIEVFRVERVGDDLLVSMPEPEGVTSAAGPTDFLVRFGAMGHIGRFQAEHAVPCARGGRVVVRTTRGLELGEVLLDGAGTAEADPWRGQPLAGTLVRAVTPEDELLERGLRAGQQRAFEACRQLVQQRGLGVELVDAEQLLDGETLIFYFLGDPPPQLADLSAELGQRYESRIEFRQFADRLEAACSTGCHNEGEACGEGGCAIGGSCQQCSEPSSS